jgi:hypothetical protein
MNLWSIEHRMKDTCKAPQVINNRWSWKTKGNKKCCYPAFTKSRHTTNESTASHQNWKGFWVRGKCTAPDIAIEWLALLLRIREEPGSDLGKEIGYPDWGVSWFPSVPPGIFQHSTQATTASFHILSSSLFLNHHTIWRYIIWDTNSDVK